MEEVKKINSPRELWSLLYNKDLDDKILKRFMINAENVIKGCMCSNSHNEKMMRDYDNIRSNDVLISKISIVLNSEVVIV